MGFKEKKRIAEEIIITTNKLTDDLGLDFKFEIYLNEGHPIKDVGIQVNIVNKEVYPVFYINDEMVVKWTNGEKESVFDEITDIIQECMGKVKEMEKEVSDFGLDEEGWALKYVDAILPVLYNKNYDKKNEMVTKDLDDNVGICFYIYLNEESRVPISTNILVDLDMSVSDLYEKSISNLERIANIVPLEFLYMGEQFGVDVPRGDFSESNMEIIRELDPGAPLVISSEAVHGAAAILVPKVQKILNDYYKDGFYIVFSSTEEVICWSKGTTGEKHLRNTVIESNNMMAETEDKDKILSYHIYELYKEKIREVL